MFGLIKGLCKFTGRLIGLKNSTMFFLYLKKTAVVLYIIQLEIYSPFYDLIILVYLAHVNKCLCKTCIHKIK